MKLLFSLCFAIFLFALVSSDVIEGGIDATFDFEELQSENIDAWIDHPPAQVEEYMEVYNTVSITENSLMLFSIRISMRPHNHLLNKYFAHFADYKSRD